MQEILIKTHLIVTSVQDKYEINWCGKVIDAKPKIKNGKPIFIIVGSGGRTELNTTDMSRIEKCAKRLTCPKGRSAITSDTARIFIKEENDNEKLLGILTHYHIKNFAPMHDKIGYKE